MAEVKRPKIPWMGVKLLLFVAALYALLFFYDSAKTVTAMQKAEVTLLELSPIFLLVWVLMAWIHTRFDAKALAKHLGEESGVRGWLLALGLGILSHGPMYAWYPMLKDLMRHGLKWGLIATFFYARAVKVPILPLMVSYFGLAFTVILTLYILLAAWVQGLLIEWLCAECNPTNSKEP